MRKIKRPTPFAQAIEDARYDLRLSLEETAEKASVSRSTLGNIFQGHVPDHETISLIAKGLGIDRTHLLLLAGIVDAPRDLADEEQEALAALRQMRPALRKNVIAGIMAMALSDKELG